MKLVQTGAVAALLAFGVAARADDVPTLRLPALDVAKINAEDEREKSSPESQRYAVAQDVAVTPVNAGIWDVVDEGVSRWRWRVVSPGAVHLNFGFTRFRLPASATLIVRGADGEPQFRSFDARDNEAHGQLWTPPVFGHDASLELTVATRDRDAVALQLGRIGQGYRGFGRLAAGAKSGSCNTDTSCLAEGDPWATVKRSVGVVSSLGTRFCTGALVNNTANDGRMLVLTATHCTIDFDNAPTLVVVWNFESPNCRLPGSTASGSEDVVGPLTQFNTGAVIRAETEDPFAGGAAGPRSDVRLLELDDPADPTHTLYWAGWDRSATPAACSAAAPCTSIHHPGGDEKRITFSHTDLTPGNIAMGRGVHWKVQWADATPALPNFPAPVPPMLPAGVVERGSSGAPLFTAQQRIVGVLSGGNSRCNAPAAQLNDFYGQIRHAWTGGGTPPTSLRGWLDPLATEAATIDGFGVASPGPLLRSGFEQGE